MRETVLMLVLAVMVYAVALNLKPADFRYVSQHPKAVVVGLIAQFVLLPLFTLMLTLAMKFPPAMAAGMMLVASCPGGALSNVLTHVARGNLALSLSISAISNLLAIVLTPLIFTSLIAANPATREWARALDIDPLAMMVNLLAVLALPVALAMLTLRFAPRVAEKIRKPLEMVAVAALFVFIIGAVAAQWTTFVQELTRTLPWVIAHNALGLAAGFAASALARLNASDTRAVVIEGGMQNSGLALGLIAAQFGGELTMVAVAGLWGIWHIVSGGALAWWWQRTAA